MERRSFLGGGAGALAALLAGRRLEGQVDASTAVKGKETPLLRPYDVKDTGHYFHQETMEAAIGTTTLKTPKCEVMAYNFPCWHPDPYLESLLGDGWTEYDLLKRARPMYPGHQMPKYPLLDYYNEAVPAAAELEVELATSHGLTGWMIDWYWHDGKLFLNRQLEEGLLKAKNREKLKFALMWANHDWTNVFPYPESGKPAMLLPQKHSVADCERVISYCAEHYFREPNYWRIGGRPVFGIFHVPKLVAELGTVGAPQALEAMRKRAQKEGIGDIHLQASQFYDPAAIQAMGFDSATMYHAFVEHTPGPRSPYGLGAVKAIETWKAKRDAMKIPFFPDCPVGWDNTPRNSHGKVTYERSADQYELLCRAARHFASDADPAICFLSSWNEWTEDHVLLPDTYFGYSYLKAVKRAFG